MTIPDFKTLLGPVLEMTADGESRAAEDMIESLSKQYDLTEDQLLEQTSSDGRVFRVNVMIAVGFCRRAGFVEQLKDGFRITDRGRKALEKAGKMR